MFTIDMPALLRLHLSFGTLPTFCEECFDGWWGISKLPSDGHDQASLDEPAGSINWLVCLSHAHLDLPVLGQTHKSFDELLVSLEQRSLKLLK